MRAPERALCSLLLLAVCGLCLVRPTSAQISGGPVPADPDLRPYCTGDTLDFRLVHNPFSASSAPARLIVVLIHNRGLTPCILPQAKLDLFSSTQTPASQSQSIDYPGPIKLSTDRWSLEPGQFAHFVLAWPSAPRTVSGRNPLDCSTQENLVLRAQGPSPWLTIRHLYIRLCGEVWVSPYRQGTYDPNQPFAQQWLDNNQLQPTAIVPTFEPAFLDPQQSPSFALNSLSPIRYLKGPAGSGYSGVFTLWLLGQTNCPYFSLSKREANGETQVQLNLCNDTSAAAPTGQPALFEIGLSNIQMLPQRAGHVEYAVEMYAPQPKPRVDTSLLELDIRDPTAPMLPAIDTKLPQCTAAQLAVAPAPVDLGSHWSTPRSFADDEKQWHDGRAFQLTNISSETCLLGGVPDLKFIYPPEMTTANGSPEVCRNCDNPVFAARESHWIDLKPAQSAHFIVSRTVLDARYQGLCTVIGGLDLMRSGRPIYLPFETASCAQVNVSAWRDGPYDSDPLNVVYNNRPRPQPATTPANPDSVPDNHSQ